MVTMEYKGFYGSVEQDEDTNCYFGEVFDISDMVSYEACSLGGLEKVFHAAVDEYLLFCKDLLHELDE